MPLRSSTLLLRRTFVSRPASLRSSLALVLVCVLFALAAAPGAAQAAAWQGREETVDGIVHVLNPAAPLAAPASLQATELWRLGGESEAEEELFGMVQTVITDENGEVYLLDVQLNEIRVFSPEGRYLRSLGREGEGPGEFRNATALFFLAGERLGVAQLMPSRIVVLDRKTGDGYADLPLPAAEGSMMSIVEQAESDAGRIVMSIMSPIMSPDGLVTRRNLQALNLSGEPIGTLKETEAKQTGGRIRLGGDENENWYRNWRLGADGRVYVAPFHAGYEIFVLGSDGALTRVIERDYASLPRSKDEIKRLERRDEDLPDTGAEIRREVHPDYRDVVSLHPRADGSLWVLTSRGEQECPANALGVFDVFDREGRFERQVTLLADYDVKYDDFVIRGDRLFVIKEAKTGAGSTAQSETGAGMMMMIRRGGDADDEDEGREPEPMSIVCYALEG